jgi:hypothetical protein
MHHRIQWLVATACAFGQASCGGDAGSPDVDLVSEAATVCTTATANGGWVNTPLAAQTYTFRVTFDATPSADFMDGIVGVANGAADGFTDLAAIVRFNPSGTLDVRNGNGYAALSAVPYRAGQTYRFRLDVNLSTHRYSVWVTQPGTTVATLIAQNFAFRTEQGAVPRLDDLAQFVDSPSGGIAVCGVVMRTLGTCQGSAPGGGLVAGDFRQQMGSFSADLDVTPSAGNVDARVALRKKTSGASLAAIVRFTPAGTIEARNGGVYASSVPLHYAALKKYHLRFDVDVANRRYSVNVTPPGAAPVAIAEGYAFDSAQAGATSLDSYAHAVDSPAGSLIVCAPTITTPPGQLQYVADHAGRLAWTPAGTLLVSNPGRTVTLDGNGAVIGDTPKGGAIAVDPNGAIAIAAAFTGSVSLGGPTLTSAGGSDVYVARYKSGWRHVFSKKLGGAGDESVREVAVDSAGNILVTGGLIGTVKLTPTGVTAWSKPLEGDDVVFDGSGNAYLVGDFARTITLGTTTHSVDDLGIYVAKLDPAGNHLWSRAFAARPYQRSDGTYWNPTQDVHHVAADAAGDVFISGDFLGAISFGGPELAYPGGSVEAPPSLGFLTKLDAQGAHVYTVATNFENPGDLVASASGIAALTGSRFNPMPFLRLLVMNPSGSVLLDLEAPTHFGRGRGIPRDVALDGLGFVYWTGSVERDAPEGFAAFPYVVKYSL